MKRELRLMSCDVRTIFETEGDGYLVIEQDRGELEEGVDTVHLDPEAVSALVEFLQGNKP